MQHATSSPPAKCPCHQLQPDQYKLMTSWCSNCGACVVDQDVQKYLAVRRDAALTIALGTAAAPLDNESFQWLQSIAAECGIENDAPTMSVVLVEGMLPHAIAYEPISLLEEALCRNPRVKVRKVHKFRQSGTRDMVVADVELHADVHLMRNQLAQSPNCVIPQWSTHITVGTVLRNRGQSMDALKRLKNLLVGYQLRVEPRWMKVFPPESLQGYSKHNTDAAVSPSVTKKKTRLRRKHSRLRGSPASSVTSSTSVSSVTSSVASSATSTPTNLGVVVDESGSSSPAEGVSLARISADTDESDKDRTNTIRQLNQSPRDTMQVKSRKKSPRTSFSVCTVTTAEETSEGSLADTSIDTVEMRKELPAKVGPPSMVREHEDPDISSLTI